METLAAALEASPLAHALRASRWVYPGVNAAHVLGVALLVGAIVPLDLRLLGLWRDIDLATLLRVLRPVAAFGATLAVLTGPMLFSVQATDYLALPLFAAKMALVATGLAHALALRHLPAASPARQRRTGALSLTLWLAALVCGRLLGYV